MARHLLDTTILSGSIAPEPDAMMMRRLVERSVDGATTATVPRRSGTRRSTRVLVARGRTSPGVDGAIAAAARVYDLVLVTANAKDFRGVSGLAVESRAP